MSITIAPDLEARIERLATARGVDANQYVTTLLTEAVAEDEQDSDANFTDEQKEALHAGITKGLEDFAEGVSVCSLKLWQSYEANTKLTAR